MKLEKIISMANQATELRFRAMVRSLRATGCDLPVWVIPYDDHIFTLPDNCEWWIDDKIQAWLKSHRTHKTMGKYQCLVTENYQFVDADVVFLRNPEEVLIEQSGFITSCGHWNNPQQTYTDDSVAIFKERTTVWQKNIFNTGQFASSDRLYDIASMKATAENALYKSTCLDFQYHEQPGLNLLVFLSGVSISNLTLPPLDMESTWAGDYTGDYLKYWMVKEHMPYLIHWAGCKMDTNRPIDQLFLKYLREEEQLRWYSELKNKNAKQKRGYQRLLRNARLVKHAIAGVSFD